MKRLRKSVWRTIYQLRFWLFQRKQLNKLSLERVADFDLVIMPTVFNPNMFLVSEFMAESLNSDLVAPNSNGLDMGTGSGIGALALARAGAHVVATDVNPAAVRTAQINALLNRLEQSMTVIESDLFASVAPQHFDTILFNPPYFKGTPQNMLDRAFRAEDVVSRFSAECGHYLAPDGKVLLLLSSDSPEAEHLAHFSTAGFSTSVAARRNLGSETVTLYQLTK